MAKRRTKKPTLTEIRRVLKKQLPELYERCGVLSLKVFGSVVRGENENRSDVDLLVEFVPGRIITLLGFVSLERELSEMLGCKVDLVEPSALKPNIGGRILSEAVSI